MSRKLVSVLIVLGAFVFLFSLPSAAKDKIKVIIDTDTAMGYVGHDVDDGLMLIMALNSPELEIVGVTAAWGNHTQRKTYAKAVEILEAAGREDIPCLRGASGPHDFGKETPASRFIRKTVLDHPGEITILAVGTLTNVATAMAADIDVAPSSKRVVSMGGRLAPPGKWPKWAIMDLNYGADVRSARTVLGSGVEFHMVHSALCLQTPVTRQEYERMVNEAPFMRDMIVEQTRSWWALKSVLPSIPGKPSFTPWDVTALAYLLHPEWFHDQWIYADIDHEGWGYKTVVVYEKDLPPGRGINAPSQIHNKKAFWDWFFKTI